ncbi:MAG: OB-fold nucleic acid binding domain-containing protein, partial [Promethearchaeota archaeon]
MFMRRATAAKLSIRDIIEGTPITGAEGRVVGVETHLGKVGRANVIATVVDLFEGTREDEEQEGGGFTTITLDDGTGVIRVKIWGEMTQKLAHIKVGDLVLVIGKIRSFQDETYLNGEVVRRLEDKNWETVRILELT